MKEVAHAPLPSPAGSASAVDRLRQFWPLALYLGALWFILCRHLSGEWSVNEQYSYGWFVPFFAAYLFWLRWEDWGKRETRNAECGIAEDNSLQDRPGSARSAQEISADLRPQSSSVASSPSPLPHSAFRDPRFPFPLSLFTFLLLAAFLPVRLFEVGNPDWRPLGWLHALLVVALTLLALYSLGGRPWLRQFAFPVAFIFVAVPWVSAIETPIVQGLMRLVASIAAETVNLFGIPAQLEGSVIRINSGVVGVNEACSGVRSLQTSIMIGLLFGELKRLTVARRVLLLAVAIAIAFVANCGRAFFLVWIAATQNVGAVGRWHDFAGYAIVGLVFLGTILAAGILARANAEGGARSAEWVHGSQRAENSGQPPASSSALLPLASDLRPLTSDLSCLTPSALRVSPFAFLLLFLGLIELGVEGWYRAHERNLIAESSWSVHFPADAPAFHELKIDEGVRQTLRFDAGKEAAWSLASPDNRQPVTNNGHAAPSAQCIAYFFRWNAGGSSVLRARAHRPDICLPNAGWKQLTDLGTADYDAGNHLRLPFRHVVFQQERGNAIAHTFFCLQEDQRRPTEARPDLNLRQGEQPDWSFAGRVRVARSGIRNLGQQVLEMVIVAAPPADDITARARFSEALKTVVAQPAR